MTRKLRRVTDKLPIQVIVMLHAWLGCLGQALLRNLESWFSLSSTVQAQSFNVKLSIFQWSKLQNYSIHVCVVIHYSLCENNMYVIYETSDTALKCVLYDVLVCLELFEREVWVFVRVHSSLFWVFVLCSCLCFALLFYIFNEHWIELFFLLLLDCFSSLNLSFWLNLNFWAVWISKS